MLLATTGLAGFFSVLPASGAGIPESTLAVPIPAKSVDPDRLHPALLKTLVGAAADTAYPILVEYFRSPDILEGMVLPGDEVEARRRLIETLQRESAARSKPILDAIKAGGGSRVRVFWIAPVIRLEASPGLIGRLSNLPEVRQIRLDAPMRLPGEPLDFFSANGLESPGADLLWNLSAIRVGQAEASFNLDGSGVVVANLDTGVDWSHPALHSSYRGYDPNGPPDHFGNWHVSTGEPYLEPGDGYGHGTHTMGTIVGNESDGIRVGVAIGAEWIAVKMIDDSGTFLESWTHDALEWILAPEGDPSLAPDVVSSSWSTGYGGDTRFQPDIQALRAGGILPVFSAGNTGPWGGTINSPADYPESLAAGAVDDIGWVTSFSSRGPSPVPWSEIKPEVAAPGIDVLSSVPGGYTLLDGTSMSAPHVAGVAALLLQADPSLIPDELENIIKNTAVPLGEPVPNNQTGWGHLDAFGAGLLVSPHGQISGTISTSNGLAPPGGALRAVSIEDGHQLLQAAGLDGSYSIAVLPGAYTLTASAFGYADQMVASLVLTDGVLVQDFSLLPEPGGWVSGTVLEMESAAPLSATVEMVPGPLSVQTDSAGRYRLPLPEGTWQLRATAPSHRSESFTVTVTVGMTTSVTSKLATAPHILLVDSGRWYYGSKAAYFRDALDMLAYPYDVWDVRDPYGFYTGLSDAPVITDLLPYDLVIWSAPGDSPGLLRVDDEIEIFLAQGGQFLISGQDVAFWDGGSNPFVLPSYFPDYLGVLYTPQWQVGDLAGVAGSPFEGLFLALNPPDSDQEQVSPDSVIIQNALVARAALVWPDEATASVLSGGCHPYRAAWTGFGLEGVGPRLNRIEAFDRYLDWFQAQPEDYGLFIEPVQEILIGAPGETITRGIRLENTGVQTDTYLLSLQPGEWPASLALPGSGPWPLTLPGCSGKVVTATVGVPGSLPRDRYDYLGIFVESEAAPQVRQAMTLTMKTPAPMLLVEDGRWQFYGDRYADVFEHRGLSFDVLDTSRQPLTPSTVLSRYPLVVWTTGQDWFLPLPGSEQRMLVDYLEGGGRLLISSQDLLNVAGTKPLAQDYLGVAAYSLEVTPTVAVAAPGGFLEPGNTPWPLDYPFVNWSDTVRPFAGAEPVLLDSALRPIGISHFGPSWRSAFYSFPLETLPPAALEQVLVDSLRWLGPLGGSRLEMPPSVELGAPIPVGLLLASALKEPQEALSLQLPLPEQSAYLPGSLSGPWHYEEETHAFTWQGDLLPGQTLSMTALVVEIDGIENSHPLDFTATFYAGDSQVFQDQARVWIGAPELALDHTASPNKLAPPQIGMPFGTVQTATFTVTARNAGWSTASVRLTDTIPAGLQLQTSTLTATQGALAVFSDTLSWQGELAPADAVSISFQGSLRFPLPFENLVSWVTAEAGGRSWAAWTVVEVLGSLYFPWLAGPH